MAQEFKELPPPEEPSGTVFSGYQRQNINLFHLQMGLDTTQVIITNNGTTILVYAGGIVESNGSLFKILNDTNIAIPNINNDYFIFIKEKENGTADLGLTSVYPTFIHTKNGWYTSNDERVLNHFYMRKTLIMRDANNENIGMVSFIDIGTNIGTINLNLPTGSKYRFQDDTTEKIATTQVFKTTPNKGYVRYNNVLTI
jgi:hypothetical protein